MRSDILALRDAQDAKSIISASQKIMQKVIDLPVYQKSKVVMFYLSTGAEVRTDEMIEHALKSGKEVVVPIILDIKKALMAAAKISKIYDASQLVFGIRQPCLERAQIVEKADIDLVFVPAIAFDKRGFRLGYGKGFYDRWLKNFKGAAIGLAYDFQIVNEIHNDIFDIAVSEVVTDK
ncbi:MAG: 5-formyltetrahydrofolate cyclo-ligase [Elusimicrobiota bacterium]|jgi:5-formyltetrahydrofolate cyclo-ligase|nr:5-formyltetrahydrofolate cyclo-ligase [Elusimicrobiota bacterium]